MPTLAQSLLDHDLGYLNIIAELWGIELDAPNMKQAQQQLVRSMLDSDLLQEVVESLPDEAKDALAELQQDRQSWSVFARRYGEVREMGQGKRDRTKPYLTPISTSEVLWYRALVGRAFFESAEGPVEFAYLPEDLEALMPEVSTAADVPFSRPATPNERATVRRANDHILDHTCSLLIALRQGYSKEQLRDISADWGVPLCFLRSLSGASGLLDKSGEPRGEEVKVFLEQSRGDALLKLTGSWLRSTVHNDLRLIPHFSFEGEWSNDPLQTRKTVMEMLRSLPKGTWWRITAFVAAVKQNQPDFQRPAGDYDSWYVKYDNSDGFLRGFEHWDEIDGELLRYLICGPLHWLGILDLAAPDKDSPAASFRFSKWADHLMKDIPPPGFAVENEKISVDTKLRVNVPRLAPRTVRYQVGRFCEWLPPVREQYRYRITPTSLIGAEEQGLKVEQLLALLQHHNQTELPHNLIKALKRWQQHGAQAQFEEMLVLRVGHPKILENLRSSRAARFLGELLGPTSVAVKAGAWQQVIEALAEMGYFSEMCDNDKVKDS